MSVTSLATIANHCFSIDPDGMAHQVSEFGARPNVAPVDTGPTTKVDHGLPPGGMA